MILIYNLPDRLSSLDLEDFDRWLIKNRVPATVSVRSWKDKLVFEWDDLSSTPFPAPIDESPGI